MVSIATGAGLGGFLGAVGGQVQKSEERQAEQDWQLAKADKLWGYEKQKHTWDVESAKSEALIKSSEFVLENMIERYKSINNRLRGDAGFTKITDDEQIKALDLERTELKYRMQILAKRYLSMAGQDPALLNQLWPVLWTTDEYGDIDGLSDKGKEVEEIALRLSKQASLTMATEEQDVGEPEDLSTRSSVLALEGVDPTGEFYGGGRTQLRRRKSEEGAEAFWGNFKLSNIYKFIGGGGEKGDAEWEAVKKSLTEKVGAPEGKTGAILSDEAASDIITSNIIEGIKDGTSKLSSVVVDLIKKGVSTLKDFSESQRVEIQEAIREAVTFPIDSAQELDAETQAKMDQDMASGRFREFASTDDAGMLAMGGGGLITQADQVAAGDSISSGVSQGLINAQNAIPRSELNLGPTPGQARQYGETRPEDFIGSTQALDALGEAGGPAPDALTEWTPESRRAKLMEDVKNLIRRAESTLGGFNAVAGFKNGDPNLTSMTIGEIHKKHKDKAVGVGQFKRRYLLDNAKKYLGYNSKELDALVFTPEIQDKFLEFGIQESGIDAYIEGKINIGKFQANLAIRWRGLPPLESSIKGEPSDEYGNIIQVPGSEAQEILESWKEFSNPPQ